MNNQNNNFQNGGNNFGSNNNFNNMNNNTGMNNQPNNMMNSSFGQFSNSGMNNQFGNQMSSNVGMNSQPNNMMNSNFNQFNNAGMNNQFGNQMNNNQGMSNNFNQNLGVTNSQSDSVEVLDFQGNNDSSFNNVNNDSQMIDQSVLAQQPFSQIKQQATINDNATNVNQFNNQGMSNQFGIQMDNNQGINNQFGDQMMNNNQNMSSQYNNINSNIASSNQFSASYQQPISQPLNSSSGKSGKNNTLTSVIIGIVGIALVGFLLAFFVFHKTLKCTSDDYMGLGSIYDMDIELTTKVEYWFGKATSVSFELVFDLSDYDSSYFDKDEFIEYFEEEDFKVKEKGDKLIVTFDEKADIDDLLSDDDLEYDEAEDEMEDMGLICK